MKKRSELCRTAPSHCQGAKALPAWHHGKVDHFTVPPSFASTHFRRRLLVAGLHAFLIKKQCEDSNCCPRLSLLIHLVFFYGFDFTGIPFSTLLLEWIGSGCPPQSCHPPDQSIPYIEQLPTVTSFEFCSPIRNACCMEEYTGRVQTFR